MPHIYHRVTLVQRTLPGVFSFEYELPTPYNVTETPKSLNLENELPSVLQFEIGSNDIGGTLSVELYLDHSRVSWFFMGYLNMKVDGIEWIDFISFLKMFCLKNDNEAVILSKIRWKIKCEIFWNQGRRRKLLKTACENVTIPSQTFRNMDHPFFD